VEWLRVVRGLSAREIEEAVAGHKVGDRPSDAKDPDRLVPLVLMVRSSTYSLFVERRTRFADERGERLTDDEVATALCRPDLDDGTAPYQTAITTCRACAKSYRVAGGREVEVSAAIVAMARCDARHLGDLESDTPQRLTSTVTPRIRRQVIARDRYMCCVPGCRSQRHLDVHHLVAQADGGSHKPSNLVTLCGGHHQQLHEGKLVIRGKAPDLVFAWRDDPTRTTTRVR
jgi:5-methylcytosine-specific restriction endonuclease McrA